MLKIVNVPLLPAEMSDKLSEGPGTTETGVISRTPYGKENTLKKKNQDLSLIKSTLN